MPFRRPSPKTGVPGVTLPRRRIGRDDRHRDRRPSSRSGQDRRQRGALASCRRRLWRFLPVDEAGSCRPVRDRASRLDFDRPAQGPVRPVRGGRPAGPRRVPPDRRQPGAGRLSARGGSRFGDQGHRLARPGVEPAVPRHADVAPAPSPRGGPVPRGPRLQPRPCRTRPLNDCWISTVSRSRGSPISRSWRSDSRTTPWAVCPGDDKSGTSGPSLPDDDR